MELVEAKIINQLQISQGQFLLKLSCPSIVKKAEPGQFVTLKINNSCDPLLRRPFSIHNVDREKGELEIFYQVLGKTTELMSKLSKDDKISIIGPLGKGFDLAFPESRALLIGGGLGQAPLLYLARGLKAKNVETLILLGARDKEGLKNIDCFNDVSPEIKLVTEDGSLGSKGFVTGELSAIIKEFRPQIIYACGPHPMLSAVKKFAVENKIPCQISLEEKMACGIGVCLGCTCKGKDKEHYPKVCTDGPVFWVTEVDLHD